MAAVGLTAWQSAAVALAVGLLIGTERERSGHGGVPAGIRTFGLAALAGCLAALAHPAVLAATVLGAAAMMAVGYVRSSSSDLGATTEVALVLTVLIGGLAVTAPALAAGAGVAAAVVLVSKDRLHRFVRESVTEVEVADALKFFVVAFIVLPLVPHARLGPYGVIDPRTIWTLVVAVTAIGWLGYVAVRVLGPGRGLPVAGLAGGFVSGVATTGAMARVAKTPDMFRPGIAGALLASVATLVNLVVVTAVADGRVAATLAPAAALGAIVLAAEAAWLTLRRPGSRPWPRRSAPDPADVSGASDASDASNASDASQGSQASRASQALQAAEGEGAAGGKGQPVPATAFAGRRPFALVPALLLAAVITVLLVVAAFAGDVFGSGGTIVAISAAGLADAHAGALTAATLAARDTLSVHTAVLAAMAAIGVNTVVKLVLALVAGGRRVCTTLAAYFAAPIVAVTLGLVITLGVRS